MNAFLFHFSHIITIKEFYEVINDTNK